jgi:three-Cys-motif partner protein
MGSPPRLNVVAIEAHAGRFKALRSAAEAFTKPLGGECLTLLRGKLADHIETVMRFGDPDEPKLFFLDPFGVQGLDASIVRRIFDRRRYEALILFSDSGAIRLDGAAQAEKHRVQTDAATPRRYLTYSPSRTMRSTNRPMAPNLTKLTRQPRKAS